MANLVDHRGNPVQSSQLRQHTSRGALNSVRNPYDQFVASEMTPTKLIGAIKAAAARDHERYLDFAAEMERRDPHYFAQLRTRKIAVSGLPRRVVAVDDSSQETAIAELLTGCINSDGFSTVIRNILDALGKGFSAIEIIWDTEAGDALRPLWLPKAFEWVNPRFIKFDRETARIPLLKTDDFPDGEPLPKYKFIYHQPHVTSGLPLAGGLARQVAAMHLFKSFAVRDWMAFAEVFGIPIRIGEHPPKASPQDIEMLREAVRDLGSDAAAVLPNTMQIHFERAGMSGLAGSDDFFLSLAGWLDSQISKAVLGQTMTSDNGSSLAQAQVHNEVRKDIRDSDIEALQEVLNQDLIRPIVDLNFGPRPRPQDYPRVDVYEEEQEDLVALSTALAPFIDRGLPVEVSVILDKFGLEMPEEGAQILGSANNSEPSEDSPPATEENVRFAGAIRRIAAAAEGTTNMRHFKKMLGEILRDV